MSWNNIPNDERLRLWKNLRHDIESLDLKEQLDTVSKFFSNMPYGSRTIDYYSPTDWPTPWEIMFHGSFCKSSISLLIFYTLTLIHTTHQITLNLIDDNGDIYLIPVIDNQFVLNYELGVVSDYQTIRNEFNIKQTFLSSEIKNIA